MENNKEAFDQRSVLIAVVSFAPPEKLVIYQQQRKWPFLMLSDAERTIYQRFELGGLSWLRMLGPATIKAYLRAILKGRRFHYYGRDDYEQGGGDFILDRQGNVLYAYRSKSPADRPSPEVLIAAIDGSTRGQGDKATGRMEEGENR